MPNSPSESSSADDDEPSLDWVVIAFIFLVVMLETAVVCWWLWGLAGVG